MTYEELQTLINKTPWIYLGKGSYNYVERSKFALTIGNYTGPWVLKTQQDFSPLSNSERAVRKWNTLNPDYPAYRTRNGWIAPFIGNKQANDLEIVEKMLDIYRATRNIIYDAFVSGNFLVHKGQVFCVDVDFAFRRGSFQTDLYVQNTYKYHDLLNFINSPQSYNFHKTKSILKALIYLEKFLNKEEIDNKYLTLNCMNHIYDAYRRNTPLTAELLETIWKIETLPLKIACKLECLTPYVLNVLTLSAKTLTITSIHTIIKNLYFDPNYVRRLDAELFLKKIIAFIEEDPTLIDHISKEGYTLLYIAVMMKNAEAVQFLIQKQTNLNQIATYATPEATKPELTALNLAIKINANEIALNLLSAGATISVQYKFLFIEDKDNYNFLKYLNFDTNYICSFRESLYLFAQNRLYWSDAQKKHFLNFLIKNPWFFEWELDFCGQTFLHCAFIEKNLNLIREISSIPLWASLLQINNRVTHETLLNLVIELDYIDLYPYLHQRSLACQHSTKEDHSSCQKNLDHTQALYQAVSQGRKAWYSLLLDNGATFEYRDIQNYSAFELAVKKGDGHAVTLFLEHGANPSLPHAEQLWPHFTAEINPILKLRKKLLTIVNSQYLYSEDDTKYLKMIYKSPYYLTWQLDNSGNTFLHFLFSKNNLKLIKNLVKHPEWDRLSQVKNKINNHNLLDTIIIHNHFNLYPYLKAIVNSERSFAVFLAANYEQSNFCKSLLQDGANIDYKDPLKGNALNIAITKGNFEICQILLEHGANPWESINGTVPAIVQWNRAHPQRTNPFNLITRERILREIKIEMCTLLDAQPPLKKLAQTLCFFSEKSPIKILRDRIILAYFHKKNSPNQTAEELLMETIKNFEANYLQPNPSQLWCASNRSLHNIIAELKDLLHQYTNPSLTTFTP